MFSGLARPQEIAAMALTEALFLRGYAVGSG
jgi:hypothetical protein